MLSQPHGELSVPKGRLLVLEKGLEGMPGNQDHACPHRAWRPRKTAKELSCENAGEQGDCRVGQSADTRLKGQAGPAPSSPC